MRLLLLYRFGDALVDNFLTEELLPLLDKYFDTLIINQAADDLASRDYWITCLCRALMVADAIVCVSSTGQTYSVNIDLENQLLPIVARSHPMYKDFKRPIFASVLLDNLSTKPQASMCMWWHEQLKLCSRERDWSTLRGDIAAFVNGILVRVMVDHVKLSRKAPETFYLYSLIQDAMCRDDRLLMPIRWRRRARNDGAPEFLCAAEGSEHWQRINAQATAMLDVNLGPSLYSKVLASKHWTERISHGLLHWTHTAAFSSRWFCMDRELHFWMSREGDEINTKHNSRSRLAVTLSHIYMMTYWVGWRVFRHIRGWGFRVNKFGVGGHGDVRTATLEKPCTWEAWHTADPTTALRDLESRAFREKEYLLGIGSSQIADSPAPDADPDWFLLRDRNDPCPCGSGKKFAYCHMLDL